MSKEDFNERQIIMGFKTIVLGLCLAIVELLSLPIFGNLQRIQVSEAGFYADFMLYASQQPYPLIFIITGIIVIMGAVWIILGYRGKKQGKRET